MTDTDVATKVLDALRPWGDAVIWIPFYPQPAPHELRTADLRQLCVAVLEGPETDET